MKKYLGVSILVLGLVFFAIPSANAVDGTYCITLGSYCDRIEITIGVGQTDYGHWDATCTNDFTTYPVMGYVGGKRPIVGDVRDPYGYVFEHTFNASAGTWDMWAYDGVNPAFSWLSGNPFTATKGSCPVLTDAQMQLPRSTE